MKKFFVMFCMSLSLVACGSNDDNNDSNNPPGWGGVQKPNSVTPDIASTTVGTRTTVTFTFDPAGSESSCTTISNNGCNSFNGYNTKYVDFIFTPIAAVPCVITYICGGQTFTNTITVTP